ncbi:hypothetical protein [Williamsia sp. 1135]|uniref:hypothetical protein n=1 Tax=Williamsia sp. 1135 TaxID=1889262 RepID=UPI000A114EE6|nr:hypothetical protein [Williamsia sp. 1135]ORM32170.1 hypothetical protein BFL43_16465 [Williamsia sp. 1135]
MPETPISGPKLRRATLAGAIAVLALAFAGCGTSTQSDAESDQGPSSIDLQLRFTPSVQFAGSYAADHLGFYDNEGVDVNMTPAAPRLPSNPFWCREQRTSR